MNKITVPQIKSQLDQLGIAYKGTKRKADLLALLPANFDLLNLVFDPVKALKYVARQIRYHLELVPDAHFTILDTKTTDDKLFVRFFLKVDISPNQGMVHLNLLQHKKSKHVFLMGIEEGMVESDPLEPFEANYETVTVWSDDKERLEAPKTTLWKDWNKTFNPQGKQLIVKGELVADPGNGGFVDEVLRDDQLLTFL